MIITLHLLGYEIFRLTLSRVHITVLDTDDAEPSPQVEHNVDVGQSADVQVAPLSFGFTGLPPVEWEDDDDDDF